MITFSTESGSHYTIDTENKKWYRPLNENSTQIRTCEGEYDSISSIELNKSVVFFGPPLETGVIRKIITSRVVDIMCEKCKDYTIQKQEINDVLQKLLEGKPISDDELRSALDLRKRTNVSIWIGNQQYALGMLVSLISMCEQMGRARWGSQWWTDLNTADRLEDAGQNKV